MNDNLNDLGRRIVRGDYAVGTLLPTEAELCRIYSVGRNSAREMIKTLSGKHLVRTVHGTGSLVLPREEWSLLDPLVLKWRFDDSREESALTEELTHLRLVLEPAISAAAAERASTTQILRVFEAYEAMDRAMNDREAAILADQTFHSRVFEAADNPMLISIARPLGMLITKRFERMTDFNGENSIYRITLPYHLNVAEAIHARDPVAAHTATVELLQLSSRELILAAAADAPTAIEEDQASSARTLPV
jgi:GntR family transcriptional regulator, galactonate operon transcriptional repressor